MATALGAAPSPSLDLQMGQGPIGCHTVAVRPWFTQSSKPLAHLPRHEQAKAVCIAVCCAHPYRS